MRKKDNLRETLRKYESPVRISRQRIRIVEVASVAGTLLFTAVFSGKYLILPIVSENSRAEKATVTYEAIKDKVVEGDILDRNGNLVMGNASPGKSAVAQSPQNYSYAYLLGYYSVNSGKENKYGLRGNLKDYSLFHLDSDNKGATTTLTIDTALQNEAYELIGDNVGSITVIDNKTGAIRALASHGPAEYDVNNLSDFLSSDVPDAQYRRGTYENDPPGSTFKVVTATAALTKAEKENLPDSFFEYEDNGSYTPEGSDYTIHNFDDIAYGQTDLERAMNYSVNCYFANLGIKTGAEQLTKTFKDFQIGKDIKIPFLCTLHSSFDLGDSKPIKIAQTSFGQGETQITPAHIALIAQAVANDGVMMSPYIVENIKSGKLPLYQNFQHKLSTCMDDNVNQKLKAVMHSTAEVYGLTESRYGMVYAKTGTAECANDRVHTYLMGFTEDAAFCISMNNGPNSALLYPVAQSLVLDINQCYGK